MKQTIQMIILSLVFIGSGCGTQTIYTGKFDLQHMEKYEVKSLNLYENSLSQYFNQSLSFKDVKFFHGNEYYIGLNCGSYVACTQAEFKEVVINTNNKDDCVVVMHELTHIVLGKVQGNSDGEHKHELFQNNNGLIRAMCNKEGLENHL